MNLICAKFGEDLFSISKVMGRKTKWPRFFGLPCMCLVMCFGVFFRACAYGTLMQICLLTLQLFHTPSYCFVFWASWGKF